MTGTNSASAIAAYYGQTPNRLTDSAVEEALQFVGQHRSSLSDEERELHIKSCGYLMEDAMRRWCETGDFGYRGEADRWKLLMQEAIKGRSQEQIRRMEQERGIA